MPRRYRLPKGPWDTIRNDDPTTTIVRLINEIEPLPWPWATTQADRAVTTALRLTGAGAPVYLDEALTAYCREWHKNKEAALQAFVLAALDCRELLVWCWHPRGQFLLIVLRDVDGREVGPARRWHQ